MRWTWCGESAQSFCVPSGCVTHARSPRAHQPKTLSMIPSNQLILCRPLLLLSSIFPSIEVFSRISSLHHVAKVSELQFVSEYSGLIFFRTDWLDLLAVQGTLKSLLQHHSSKASILWHSAFFTVQLSHPYMTIQKTIALTRWTFVGKVMSLPFNMLSKSVITFLPRSKCLLSWNFLWDESDKGIFCQVNEVTFGNT